MVHTTFCKVVSYLRCYYPQARRSIIIVRQPCSKARQVLNHCVHYCGVDGYSRAMLVRELLFRERRISNFVSPALLPFSPLFSLLSFSLYRDLPGVSLASPSLDNSSPFLANQGIPRVACSRRRSDYYCRCRCHCRCRCLQLRCNYFVFPASSLAIEYISWCT
jgi:hypothetical protein